VTEAPLLRIRDLGVSFDNGAGPRVQAVDGARMSIYPGQTLAVVGESGCGKSVTALSILQLLSRPPARFDRGQILFRGEQSGAETDLLTLPPKQIRSVRGNEIAMIFQEPMTSLNPVYSVGDQIIEAVLLHQRVSDKDALRIAKEAMRDVGIPDPDRRIRQYPTSSPAACASA
jgi:ABC-type dipeptide/oligopeptide/nickel transport system ATPase component